MSDGTFTQADLDRLIAERLATAKAQHREVVDGLRADLGRLTGEVPAAQWIGGGFRMALPDQRLNVVWEK